MRLCLQCGFTRYTKRSGVCQKCGHHLTQVDGRLRKVVESLTRSEYAVAFATCETTAVTNISYVGIILCFNQIYDDFVFSSLPKNFRHISDSHHPSQYTLSFVLNHPGCPTSMVIYEYYSHPTISKPVDTVLKEAIADLYAWALDVENTAKWAVYKLAGYL